MQAVFLMEILSGPKHNLLYWGGRGVQLRKGRRRTTEKWGNARHAADTIERYYATQKILPFLAYQAWRVPTKPLMILVSALPPLPRRHRLRISPQPLLGLPCFPL